MDDEKLKWVKSWKFFWQLYFQALKELWKHPLPWFLYGICLAAWIWNPQREWWRLGFSATVVSLLLLFIVFVIVWLGRAEAIHDYLHEDELTKEEDEF